MYERRGSSLKVFRFMSQEEFDKYLAGEKLINTTDHRKKFAFTGSKGFCFFEYMDWDDDGVDGITPEYAYEFLSGIVTEDVVAVFETDKQLTESYGRYADPYGAFFDTIRMDEYCTTEYDNKSFHLIKYGHIERDDDFELKAVWNTERQEA